MNIKVRTFDELGQADFGWLKARHHFSFGHYYNPENMGFKDLRVVNDDRIAAGSGFDPHPHKNMEIITYVREGSIRHKDNLGNEGVTPAGDVQVMSAGTGVAHAEYADEHGPTTLYQIWIIPHTANVTPRWEQATFDKAPVKDGLRLLVSGIEADAGKGALFIHQHAAIWGGRLDKGTELAQSLRTSTGYVLVSSGEVSINGTPMKAGDGAEVEDTATLTITASTDAEVLVLELPA